MKRAILLLILIAYLNLGFVSLIYAGETHAKKTLENVFGKADIQISGSTSFYSKYVWRGFRLDGDPVLQPSVTISAFYGWAVNIWSNFDLRNKDSLHSKEIDSALTYTHKFENIDILGVHLKPISTTIGNTYYEFPANNTFSRETILGLGYEIFLNPSITWYHDYGNEKQGGGHGNYIMLCLGHSFNLIHKDGVTFDLNWHAGYNQKLYIVGKGGDVALTMGLTIPLTKNINMQPTINWSSPSGDMSHENDGNYKDVLFTGFTFNYNL